MTQRPLTDIEKGKAKMDIHIDATQRDQRGDDDPNYYVQTDATKQFQQVSCLGCRYVLHELMQHHCIKQDILGLCVLISAPLDKL